MTMLAITQMFSGPFQPGWIIVVSILAAVSCALLGNYLVLRRMSMMGDAISHAVLPGVAVAFILTGSRGSVEMFIGGAIVGVLTAVLTEWIHKKGHVESGAAMGVVFTTLFALGLILIRQVIDHVDLDPECVLYGNVEVAALRQAMPIVGGTIQMPLAVWTIGVTLLINVAFVALFWKELKISSFDPALATTMGISATFMQYALMALVAMTTVAAFEAVGSIIVIAMLIVPGAAAHLLTDRLNVMVGLSVVFAAVSAVGGYYVATDVPVWLGYEATRVSGGMAVTAGVMFLGVMLAAPRRGIVSQVVRRQRLSLRILQEDVLGLLYRLEEMKLDKHTARAPAMLRETVGAGPLMSRLAIWRLRQRGLVDAEAGEYHLSERGRTDAANLMRSHRLWETYLAKHVQAPTDHMHDSAELLEHVTDADLQQRLNAAADRPDVDPQGKVVPADQSGVH